MSTKFIEVDRAAQYLFPPSVQDWLPEKHLARFVVEIVEQLDLRPLKDSYSCRGSQPYHPAMLLALLFYGYATGVFSSRKLERSTYDSVAFRYIAANSHPDHDTIAQFRKRFLPQRNRSPGFFEYLKKVRAFAGGFGYVILHDSNPDLSESHHYPRRHCLYPEVNLRIPC